jgi:RNA polymerase-binding transcription factor DksA
MNYLENFEYNNEEEAEMAQLHSIHLHLNAVSSVQQKLAAQAKEPSLENCEECGEEIAQARRLAVPGVKLCIYCKEISERKKQLTI